MPSMDSVVTSLGDVREHTRKVAHEIADRWTLYFIWGIGSSGEHAEGRALDFMGMKLGGGVSNPGAMRRQVCDQIADYLWRHRERLGVWYVIWDRRIISMTYESQGWRDYDGSNPHTDHVHVSFYNNVSYRPPTNEEDEDMPSAKEIAEAVWEHRVPNLSQGSVAGQATARWLVQNIEESQDQQHKELRGRIGALEKAVEAIGSGLGEDVAQAVRDALAEATVQVDVNVRQGENGEQS